LLIAFLKEGTVPATVEPHAISTKEYSRSSFYHQEDSQPVRFELKDGA
jgi:hypothetical protein